MRNSTKESMNFRCKLLHYEVNRSLFTEEILCLYYDFSEGEVRADSCNRNKPFICMNPQFGKNQLFHIQFVAIIVRMLDLR